MKTSRAAGDSTTTHGVRLLVVPRAHVTQLFTDGSNSVRRIALTVDGQAQTLTVGQKLAATCSVVLAAGTIESTRLALLSFPSAGMGSNLMAHLRSNTTVRVKRTVFGLGPAGTDLETAAFIVRALASVSGGAKRQFHLQVTAAPSPTSDTEVNLFTDYFRRVRSLFFITLRHAGWRRSTGGAAPIHAPP